VIVSERTRPILTAAAVLVLVAGCASSGGATTAPTAAATAAPSAAASTAPSAAGSGTAYEVDVANDPKIGAYLTGATGLSLYILGTDTPGTSTCTGDCAANWPPFTLNPGDTVKAGSGVTGTIATFTRPDGTTQVTINGLPLYYFAGDLAAGQTNGQGIGNKWYVAGPNGTQVGASAAATPAGSAGGSAAPTKCAGYYCP